MKPGIQLQKRKAVNRQPGWIDVVFRYIQMITRYAATSAWHETVHIGQLNGKRNRTFGCISGTQIHHFCNSVEHPETFWNMRDSVSALRALGCSLVRLHLCVACVLCGRANTVLTLQGVTERWKVSGKQSSQHAIIPTWQEPGSATIVVLLLLGCIPRPLFCDTSFLRM